jgi:hypothetical protein
MQQYRQGDLLFIKQEALPADLVARESRVIVEGESTGHAHRLTSGTVLDGQHGAIWLDLDTTAEVVHEEHGAITLDPGPWLVIRQREYAPEAIKTVRTVRD